MANSICAVTEASDKFFHLTRVSVYSFIEHNRWFDGTLKLLVHQDLPLSERNLLLLKLIYPTIEIISINSQTTNQIKKLAAFRNSNKYIDLLFDTLKIFIFTIPATKILYFSNKCLFLNNVVDILISGKIVSDENFSLAYIDGETNPIQLDIANIPPFEEIISSINSLNYTILPAVSSYSANYPNAKFNNIVQSKLKNFPSIIFNTFTSESARYSKINQIWLHKNHEISNNLQRPSIYKEQTPITPIKNKLKTRQTTPSVNFNESLAIFTTLNENYVTHAIVSFQTFRDLNPNLKLDFFIIGNNLSNASISIIENNLITYIDLDLTNIFSTLPGWPYPSECFWLFKGPDIFNNLGYKYSMYIDADVQCNLPLNLSWIESLELLGGANRGSSIHQFISKIDNLNRVISKFNISLIKIKNSPAINSGVLFFNNLNYSKLEIFKKSVDLFTQSKAANIPRKGDDSLLCLLMAVFSDYNYHILPNSWNDYHFYKNDKINHFNSYIIHNFRQKPWLPINLKYIKNKYVNSFILNWKNTKQKLILNGKL